jgi:hypothetical protein
MADEVEVRKVIVEVQYNGIPIPSTAPPMIEPIGIPRDWIEAIRRELIRTGSRNPDIFGGRA